MSRFFLFTLLVGFVFVIGCGSSKADVDLLHSQLHASTETQAKTISAMRDLKLEITELKGQINRLKLCVSLMHSDVVIRDFLREPTGTISGFDALVLITTQDEVQRWEKNDGQIDLRAQVEDRIISIRIRPLGNGYRVEDNESEGVTVQSCTYPKDIVAWALKRIG